MKHYPRLVECNERWSQFLWMMRWTTRWCGLYNLDQFTAMQVLCSVFLDGQCQQIVGHKQLEARTKWATRIFCVCILIGGEDDCGSRLCYTNPPNSGWESILNVDFSNKYSKMLTIQPPAESTRKIVLMATQTLFAHWRQIKNAPLELWSWFSVFIVFLPIYILSAWATIGQRWWLEEQHFPAYFQKLGLTH